jgi:DNA-binding transcriptional MerR regulator
MSGDAKIIRRPVYRRGGPASGYSGFSDPLLRTCGALPPARLVNTKRRYTPDIFPQLLLISYAQESGLTIAEIRVVLNPEQEANLVGGWQALARQKLLAMEQRMRHLERMKAGSGSSAPG